MTDPSPEPSPSERLCPCGHSGEHEHIVEDPVYRGVDYVWMLLGVSSRAVPCARKCAVCGFVFEVLPPRRPW